MSELERIVTKINNAVNSVVWGPLMLILLVGIGMYFTIRTNFLQIRRWKDVFRNIFRKSDQKKGESISSFQAASTSLAGCIGTGNIVGVATALVSGGPGALFWMWVSAFFGMMTKYAEIILSVQYRDKNKQGELVGGPMYYIEKGLHMKWLGVLFAVFCTLASFGIGNMTQINSISASFQDIIEIDGLYIGILFAVIVGIVIIGGIQRIAGVSAIFVPLFAIIYMVGAIVVLIANIQHIPSAFALIMKDAFDFRAAGGGILGFAMMNAMRYGITRGVFSNEAGLGSAPFAHAASGNQEPVEEGFWGIFEVFFDTIVMCTITGLVILTSGVLETGLTGAALTSAAFSTVFTQQFTKIFIAVAISFFAFSTLLSWSYYGECCVEYLFHSRLAVKIYKCAFLACVVLGAMMELELVWSISDTLNGAMAIPNLVALIGLSGVVIQSTKKYFSSQKSVLEK